MQAVGSGPVHVKQKDATFHQETINTLNMHFK